MTALSTTRLSSKGQVVIPEDIRKSLRLHAGDNFIAVAERDMIILKLISKPSLNELDHLIKRARVQSKKAGLKKSAIKAAIDEARKKS